LKKKKLKKEIDFFSIGSSFKTNDVSPVFEIAIKDSA